MFRLNPNKAKCLVSMLIFFLFFAQARGQESAMIKVLDQKGQPIPYASALLNNGKGVVGDANGIIAFNSSLSPVKIFAMGYEELVLESTAEETNLTVRLSDKVSQLQEVVVTGELEAVSARKSVFQVRTIDKEIIHQRAASNIQEVLNTELGIRFSQDNALGATNLEMLGLSGQNVKVLLDGVPMVGRQGVSNEININQIDINNIERIELVEGPMSVVYGADALAGVINIITKKANEENHWSISTRLQEETVGTAYRPFAGAGTHLQNIQGSFSQASWSFDAGITRNQFGGWKGNYTGRQFEWLPKDQLLFNTSVGFLKENYQLTYSLNGLSEKITHLGPESRIENIDRHFITDRWMHSLMGQVAFHPKLKMNGQIAFTDYQRETETWVSNVRTGEQYQSSAGGTGDKLSYQGLNVRLQGAWKWSATLSLQPGIDFNIENGVGDRISENEGLADYAFFLTGEWSPTGTIKIRPGLRSAYNTGYQAPPVIPSLNTKFILGEGFDLRLAYAQGFRAPSLRELYFDFFDASHSIRGNPELEAETSHSYNASLNFHKQLEKDKLLTNTLTGFYNDIDNRIAYGIDPSDVRITTLFNIEKFKTLGFTFNQKWTVQHAQFNLGFSRIGRYNRLMETEGMEVSQFLWTNEINALANYVIQPIQTNVNLFYKWTGKMPSFQLGQNADGETVPELVEIADYHWLDLTLQRSFGEHLSVNLGVKNLTNVTSILSTAEGGAHGGGPQRPMGYGRSYFLGLTYNFFKKK